MLRRAAVVSVLGLAGCTGDGSPPGADGDGTPTPDDGTPTTEPPTTEPPETVEIADFAFSVTDRTSSATEPTADVTFDAESNAVQFTGIIEGSDGCKTAALDAIDFDRAGDEVTLAVITKDRPGAGDMCTQQLVYISYEATVEFSGGLPSQAAVSHDGSEIASEAQ